MTAPDAVTRCCDAIEAAARQALANEDAGILTGFVAHLAIIDNDGDTRYMGLAPDRQNTATTLGLIEMHRRIIHDDLTTNLIPDDDD